MIKRINKMGWLVGVLFGLAAVQGVSHAQELKLAAIDIERLLRESNAGKAADQKLKQEFSKKEKDLQDMAARLKAAADKFDKDAPVMSESEKQRRQRELGELDRDFQRKRREVGEDYNQRLNDERVAIEQKMAQALKELADKEKFDLIFRVQELVFASPRTDITDKVLKIMNAGK